MNTQKCISDADIGRLLDGIITSQEKQSLHEHIKTCPQCKARWQQASAGAGHLDALFAKVAGKCLSEDLLAGFVNGTLDQAERRNAEDHLARCLHCQEATAEKFADACEKESNNWWSEYAASQMLSLLAMVPDQVDDLLESLNLESTQFEQPTTIIKLPILEPAQNQARRLAAATGEGFSVQTFKQDKPPFEFELAQFGEQLRITARSVQEDSPYENCLARLTLLEQADCRWSQIILIEKGEGKCVLEPEDIRGLRPQEKHLALKLEPIVTLEQFAAAGSEAYKPILSKLLKHEDPKIRCAAVKVAARIYGLDANSLIEPMTNDENQMVRQVVEEALNQFPGSQD